MIAGPGNGRRRFFSLYYWRRGAQKCVRSRRPLARARGYGGLSWYPRA